MQVNAKFFCNHCGSMFDAKDTEKASIRCPVCDGYKVSLQLDLWNDPDPEEFSVEVDSDDIPE